MDRKVLWIWETGCGAAEFIPQSRFGRNVQLARAPVLRMDNLQVQQFAIGKSCAMVVSKEGKCYQVGQPGASELSLAWIERMLFEVSVLKPFQVSQVACGYHHVVAIVHSGPVFCWGASSFGQCGVVAEFVTEPNLITYLENKHVNLKRISCGRSHTMAISTENEVWGWGVSHMIGGASAVRRNAPCPKPEIVQSLCGRRVLQVSCGKYHTVVLSEKIPKSSSNTNKQATTEVCEICHQEIYKWEDKELMMQDNGDQVIISDSHTCIHESTPKVSCSTQGKNSSHVRSLSLPFFKSIGQTSSALAEKPHEVPMSQQIALNVFSLKRVSSENDLSISIKDPTGIEPGLAPQISKTEPNFEEHAKKNHHMVAEDVDSKDLLVTIVSPRKELKKKAVTPTLRTAHLSKSASMPSNLWKEDQNDDGDVFLPSAQLFSNDSTFLHTPLGSSSASLTSLDDCKSRMTLTNCPDADMNLDPQSALTYLRQLSPGSSENHVNTLKDEEYTKQPPTTANVESELDIKGVQKSRGSQDMQRSISERITKSITDNRLISPLTSYSKDVFSGVMDQIEWIKTSAYDKGVAPIKGLWTKDKNVETKTEDGTKGEKTEADDMNPGLPVTEGSFRFTSDHTIGTLNSDPLSQGSLEKEGLPVKIELWDPVTLRTEVWSWGENKHGALGLADHLDRLQPTCVNTLSHRGVVKIACGGHHTVALTSNSDVYTWGNNSHGQLGHNKSNTRTPEKLECKHCVWDIAAGKCHTLVLADGVGQKPDVYVCGSGLPTGAMSGNPLQTNESRKGGDWKLRPFEICHKMGFQCAVLSGLSSLSSCLTNDNSTSSTITLHNFAKAEREFYRQVTSIKTDILKPLRFSDLYKLFENTIYWDLLSQTMEMFGTLCYNIGLNAVRVTRAIVGSEACSQEVFSYIGDNLIDCYKKYSESLNDTIAYGFFEKCEFYCTKRSKFLSQPKVTELFKKLLGDKRLSKLPSENFLQVLQYPAFRLREYASTLNKLALSMDENSTLAEILEKLSAQWNILWTKVNNQLLAANNTRAFWKNEFKASSGLRLAESLKKVGRYLILHSKKVPLDVAHSALVPRRLSFNWFILFSDCLVIVHYASHFVHPLKVLWCSPHTDGKEKNGRSIKFTMPEEEIVAIASTDESKSIWLNALYTAINRANASDSDDDAGSFQNSQFHRPPPTVRHASYTFTKEPELRKAKYVGAWMAGKPHGKGEFTWEDGKSYKGYYANGLEDGFGEWKAGPTGHAKLKYRGWWKNGKMEGYGKVWYSKFQTYEGSFVGGLREGHGTLRTGSVTEGSVYVGGWKKDQRSGFGVEDGISKGEKYLGMWANDQRHGVGILVTLDGLYCQSCFVHGEIRGEALVIEGRYVFEGNVSAGMVLNGKGRLSLPTGDKLEGSFVGQWSENIRMAGNLVRVADPGQLSVTKPDSPRTPMDFTTSFNYNLQRDHAYSILRRYNRHIMKKYVESNSSRSFPLMLHPDIKWKEIFSHYCLLLTCPLEENHGTVNTKKVWEAISVAILASRQRRQVLKEKLSPQKRIDESKLKWLDRVPPIVNLENNNSTSDMHPTSDDVKCIKEYLVQSFSTTLHPLGDLAESLGNIFRDSYSGTGAHKWLLTQAVADIRSFVRRLYNFIRCMFPQLAKEQGNSHMKVLNHEATEKPDGRHGSEDSFVEITAGDLLLPVLLPRVYPTLFTLYALRHEDDDRSYWERVTRLNRHPDVALLSFLGVKPKFWLLDEKEIPPLETPGDDEQLYGNEERAESSKWRHLLVARARDCSFLAAVETLQLISTTFIPAEKLNVIYSTFKEINTAVKDTLHKAHTWSMDDLFPVFQYVVIRARISHLGCEIQLIEDFLEPDMCKGEKGIMFTTLKACYFQIRMEKDL